MRNLKLFRTAPLPPSAPLAPSAPSAPLALLALWAALALLPAPASAQTPPPDSVSEVLRQKIQPGTAQKYEAARKEHMGWHKAHNDPWTWEVFEVMTGPDTGSYLISSGDHQWKDMEAWAAKMADADGADSAASMGPYIAGTQRTYWTQLNALSRMPEADVQYPLITLTTYHVKPGSDAALRAAIAKVNAALEAGKFPISSIWFVLTNGGPTPTYAVVAPRTGLGEMGPSPSLLQVLEKQLGKPASDALVKSFFDNVVSANSELLRFRTDLSYLPK
jgi:hypothetical protein